MIGIYKVTSPSGKIYIGQSKHIERRFKEYQKGYCKGQKLLYRSLMKYGSNNHLYEVLEILDIFDKKELDNREIFFIDKYKSMGFSLLNLTKGGTGALGYIYTKEERQNLSNRMLGNSYNVGKTMTLENKELLRNRMKGNKYTLGNKQSDSTKQLRNKKLSKPITQLSLDGSVIKYWESTKQASNDLNISSITMCLKGKYSHAGGYKWLYTNT